MKPNTYTELFFLDEAVALAAGHRPCAECRRADYTRFTDAWSADLTGQIRAPDIDAALHPARVTRQRTQVTYQAALPDLPDGCFIRWDGHPHLINGGALLPYHPEGYVPRVPRPTSASVTVLTPAPTVSALRAGYRPALHPTAG